MSSLPTQNLTEYIPFSPKAMTEPYTEMTQGAVLAMIIASAYAENGGSSAIWTFSSSVLAPAIIKSRAKIPLRIAAYTALLLAMSSQKWKCSRFSFAAALLSSSCLCK